MLTRRAALASFLAAGLSCARKRGTGYPGLLWVATARDQAVSVVDLQTFRLSRKIEVGAAPSAVLTGASTAPVVVVTPANGSLHILDAGAQQKTASFRVADDLLDGRLLPDGKTVALVSRAGREFLLVDVASRKVTSRQKLPGVPTAFELTGADNKESAAAIALGQQGTVVRIALSTGQKTTAHVSASVGTMRYRNDGGVLFVANNEGRSLLALDGATLQVIADLPLALRPEHFCFSSDHGQLFVTGAGMDAVAIVFTYSPLIVEQTVLAGRAPTSMACSENPPYLFLASSSGTEINIMSVFNRKVIAVVQAGLGANQILITPDNQYALVLNGTSGDVAVIRIPAIRGNRNKSGAALFTMVPVGDQPVSGAITSAT